MSQAMPKWLYSFMEMESIVKKTRMIPQAAALLLLAILLNGCAYVRYTEGTLGVPKEQTVLLEREDGLQVKVVGTEEVIPKPVGAFSDETTLCLLPGKYQLDVSLYSNTITPVTNYIEYSTQSAKLSFTGQAGHIYRVESCKIRDDYAKYDAPESSGYWSPYLSDITGNGDMLVDGGQVVISAAYAGRLDILRSMVEKGADVNAKTDDGHTALMSAAYNGKDDAVNILLDKGADINAAASDGATALDFAIDQEQKKIITVLEAHGAEAKAPEHVISPTATKAKSKKRSGNATALYIAAQDGQPDNVKALLAQGTYVNAKRSDGYTALLVAAENGHADVVKILIDQGADVNTGQDAGATALMGAALKGYADIVTALLERGADVNATASNGATALINAAYNGQSDCVKALLKKGADMNIRNSNGRTALMLATKNGHAETIGILQEAGAKE